MNDYDGMQQIIDKSDHVDIEDNVGPMLIFLPSGRDVQRRPE